MWFKTFIFLPPTPVLGVVRPLSRAKVKKNKKKKNKKLGFRPLGGRTTPMGHGGGSVTPRPKATPFWPLGVAEPPSRAMEVVWLLLKLALSHPYNFILFFIFNIYIWGQVSQF